MKCGACGHEGSVTGTWMGATLDTFRRLNFGEHGPHFPGEGAVELFYCPKCGTLKADEANVRDHTEEFKEYLRERKKE